MGAALAAAFITVYFIGPQGQTEEVAGLQSFSVNNTYPGAGFQQQASTFRQERTLGAYLLTGQGSRIQQRKRSLPVLLYRVLNLNSGQGIRFDMMPIGIVVQYSLVGPNFDYTTVMDAETRAYSECYVTVHGDDLITSGTSNAMESFTFETQNSTYSDGSISLISVGNSANFPNNLRAANSVGPADGGRSSGGQGTQTNG